MSQHEDYTAPPGFRVSGAGGTKLAPVLIDPAAPASEGDVITRVGAGYAPQTPSGSGVQVTPLRTITSAELLALHTSGIAFDCPAGSLPIAATFVNHPGNTPYSSVGGNIYAQIGYPGGSRTNVLADVLALTAFLASAEGNRMIVPVGAALTDEPFIGATEVLTLSCSNADRHLADGNGTISVQVAYLASG